VRCYTITNTDRDGNATDANEYPNSNANANCDEHRYGNPDCNPDQHRHTADPDTDPSVGRRILPAHPERHADPVHDSDLNTHHHRDPHAVGHPDVYSDADPYYYSNRDHHADDHAER
jgi:hypothetical protein